MRLSIGELSLELPGAWDREIDLVWRVPTDSAYRSNLRLTYRSADTSLPLAALGDAYEDRLREGMHGSVERIERRDATAPTGADEAMWCVFRVQTDEREVIHRALIARGDDAVVTVATSHRVVEDDQAAQVMLRVLESVRFG